jgi:integrase/recombinase XerD
MRGSADGTNRVPGVIESLFVHRDAIARHLSAPMLAERQAYLSQLLELGRRRQYVAENASLLCHVIRFVNTTASPSVSDKDIAEAAMRWITEADSHRSLRPKGAVCAFTALARSWFRFLGAWTPHPRPPCRFESSFVEFVASLGTDLGYLPASVQSCASPTRRFLVWASSRKHNLSSITLSDVDDFLAERRAAGWGQRTVIDQCQALRIFFRYAERRGWSQNALSKTIKAPRFNGHGNVVRCPSWKEVRSLLDSLDDSNHSHCRTKAILLLASVYGLRQSEIIRLTLEDFDWYNEVITVRRSKRGRVQQFPLQFEVGEAIIRYLRIVRPPCKSRNVFVTLQAPYRPAVNIGSAMRKILNARGIFDRPCGLHALRHACATELLRRGTSLRGIADFLGHRSIHSVSVYARCDILALRKVANFSLKGVL